MKKQKMTTKISAASKAITLLIVLSSIAALAASVVLYERKGVSEIRLIQDDGADRRIERKFEDFDVRRLWDTSAGEELILVSSKKHLTEYLDAEGMDGTISWDVRSGEKFQNALWNKTEQVTELRVHPDQPVMVTGLGGCCGEMTGYRLFNLRTGLLLMAFNDFDWENLTTQPFSLEVPNSDLVHRYIGIISQDSTRDRDFVPPVAGKSAAILIKYANETLKQKIQVDMTTAPDYGISVMEVVIEKDPAAPNSDKIEFNGNQAHLWNIDGSNNPADIRGVQLKVVLNAGEGDKTLIIPVKNDQLDLSLATLPIGVSLNALH